MVTNLTAIYEDGAFRPLEGTGVHLANGTKVRLTVEEASVSESCNTLDLAANVYDGLTSDQIDEVEQIANDRTSFFKGR